jgi:hypothetical protein
MHLHFIASQWLQHILNFWLFVLGLLLFHYNEKNNVVRKKTETTNILLGRVTKWPQQWERRSYKGNNSMIFLLQAIVFAIQKLDEVDQKQAENSFHEQKNWLPFKSRTSDC